MSYAYTNPPHTDTNKEAKPFTKVNPWTGYYPSIVPFAVAYDDYVKKYTEYYRSGSRLQLISCQNNQDPS